MMKDTPYDLTIFNLSIAAFLVLALAGLSFRVHVSLGWHILIAALRTTVQLSLIGLILSWVFNQIHLGVMSLIAALMLIAASREVVSRQTNRFVGWWGYLIGFVSMFASSFTITLVALSTIIHVKPWYHPQYAIPMLGMLLGNTMTGVAVGLDRLTTTLAQKKQIIENRLMLGQPWSLAIENIRRECFRSGLIPIINAMAAAGLVSLPGMMTGQILAGVEPMLAVKYQILMMFLVASGTGFGTYLAIWLASRHCFDERQRLRLDRLHIQE